MNFISILKTPWPGANLFGSSYFGFKFINYFLSQFCFEFGDSYDRIGTNFVLNCGKASDDPFWFWGGKGGTD